MRHKSIKRASYSKWRDTTTKNSVSGLDLMRAAHKKACGLEGLRKPRGLHVTKIGDLKMIWARVENCAEWWREDTNHKKPIPKKLAAFLWCAVALDKAIMERMKK